MSRQRLVKNVFRIILGYIVFGGLVWMIYWSGSMAHIFTALKWVFYAHVFLVCVSFFCVGILWVLGEEKSIKKQEEKEGVI